jgi:Co/Zn/Cd efflux system component
MGNIALSCHIQTSSPMKTLKKATRLVNTKYKILHTTIQIENVEEDHFKCEIIK